MGAGSYDLYGGYINGYLEKVNECGDVSYEGKLAIEGIELSPIHGMYFKKGNESYLWIKRKPVLEYDIEKESYYKRERLPRWECYMKKTIEGNSSIYVGTFYFLKWKYDIKGIWDGVLGNDDSKNRLNFYIERCPMSEQVIIREINNMNKKEGGKYEK